jgi:hypothetical protein
VKNMTGAIYVAGALDYETRKRVSTRKLFFPFDGIDRQRVTTIGDET